MSTDSTAQVMAHAFKGCRGNQFKIWYIFQVSSVLFNRTIFNEPTLKTLQINVETFKGVVQLSGFVDSEQSAGRAAEVARSVNGVVSVKNDLVVK